MLKRFGFFLAAIGLIFSMNGTAKAEEKSRVGLAMVALAEPRIPSGDEILHYLKTKWPHAKSFGEMHTEDDTIFFHELGRRNGVCLAYACSNSTRRY